MAALTLCAWTGSAFAQSSEDDPIYEQIRQRRQRSRRRSAPSALAAMRERYAQTHEARALATMGFAEVDLGRCGEAEPHLAEALAMSSRWVEANRRTLEAVLESCLQENGVGALVVRSGAAGAEVFVNGAQFGAAGRYVRATVGTMTYELRAAGFVSAQRTVTIRRGVIAREQVELTAEPAPTPTAPPEPALPPPATTPTQPPAAVEQPVSTPPPEVRPPPPPTPDGTLRTLAWVSGAGALVLAGVGVAGYVVGDTAATRWNSDACIPAGSTREATCGNERETAESMRAVAIAGFAGAGAFAVATAVLFALSPRRAPRTTLACGRGPGALGVACAVRF